MSPVWGSPLVADGKVYLGDADGDVAVLKAGTEMKKISVIDMGDSVYSTPVPANGVLYIMTRSELYAIAVSAGWIRKVTEIGARKTVISCEESVSADIILLQ